MKPNKFAKFTSFVLLTARDAFTTRPCKGVRYMKKFILLFLFYPLYAFSDESCSNFLEKHTLDNDVVDLACLWNESHTAVAVCLKKVTTKCFVIDSENITDVSKIEQSNLGKLGIAKKAEYKSVQTKPIEWLSSKENLFLVSFQTRAWLKGQRYTVAGPAAVTNGEYHAQ